MGLRFVEAYTVEGWGRGGIRFGLPEALLELTKSANSPWPARTQELRLELAYREFAQEKISDSIALVVGVALQHLKCTNPEPDTSCCCQLKETERRRSH